MRSLTPASWICQPLANKTSSQVKFDLLGQTSFIFKTL